MLIDFRKLFPKYKLNFQGVLHVGGNIGEEIEVYKELGIQHQVWFEPNPELHVRLAANLQKHEIPYHIAFNYAAGEENKQITLHIANNGGQSSSVLELGTHAIVHPDVKYVNDIIVQMRRIDEIFENDPYRHHFPYLDLLNIDVQGLELQVLRGIGKHIRQFKAIYLEVNRAELYKGCALIDSIDLFMTANGFTRVETLWCGDTGWGDAFFIKEK